MPSTFKSRFSGMFRKKGIDRVTARERVEAALAESNPALAASEFRRDRAQREKDAENRAREGQLIPDEIDTGRIRPRRD